MTQFPEPSPALPSSKPRELVHHLNNQLAVVFAHLELVEDDEDPTRMRAALDAIAKATTSMADRLRAHTQAQRQSSVLAPREQVPGSDA